MLPDKFCAKCGFRFSSDDANFCSNCGTKRGLYSLKREEDQADRAPAAPAQAPVPICLSSDTERSTSVEVSLNSSSTGPDEPPSYKTIFKPTPNRLKKPGKLYGKKALRDNWGSQHKRVLNNYKEVRKWIHVGQEKGVLPAGTFTLENEAVRKNLHRVIEENHGKLKAIKVKKGEDYTWNPDDICKKEKRHLKYLRQRERRQQRAKRPEPSHFGSDSSQVQISRLWRRTWLESQPNVFFREVEVQWRSVLA